MGKIEIKNLNLWYGKFQALIDVNMNIEEKLITSIIGPSGCGKSTLLRVLNRMNDLIENTKTSGEIIIEKENILFPGTDLIKLRKNVGMVFQRPNPFPLSIRKNIAFGLEIHSIKHQDTINEIVENSLRSVLLWDDLKDKLNSSALELTLEQQQRLCVARLLPVKPEILLMDEPCSSLDPIATGRIEELMFELKKNYTIVIVTHNMQQAARVSNDIGFMLLGKLIEFNKTEKIFTNPDKKETNDYITGRFG
ncbi:MAG: phosphate ABC transporter ATP-binding protein [Elusimicrobia bacterium]|nr:phosphate ABC transporter ATP-binding protein [Elusimicrobiota bacterium]MBU2614122.1 phosphate ABC transporter ATP-binding protein [Elusimicrobiota bacterium]